MLCGAQTVCTGISVRGKDSFIMLMLTENKKFYEIILKL